MFRRLLPVAVILAAGCGKTPPPDDTKPGAGGDLAKLGLLAGVAGVITAAVFHRPAAEAPAPPVQAAVSAQPPRVTGAVPAPRPVAAARPRPEVEARAVSRPADEEE